MKQISLVLVGMGVSMMLIGCGLETSRIDADFGTSYQLAKANQILNPDADKNLEPVTGLSAAIAQKVADNYTQGFERTSQAPTYVFQVGTAK